jgi:hypothetical protein
VLYYVGPRRLTDIEVETVVREAAG